jgi:hypothetical protein
MTKKDKELLLFYLNNKRKQASEFQSHNIENRDREAYHRGQRDAYSEIHSMITNIKAEDET